ncbi:hypothetical protein KUTeg_000479, partial [Tegillarca granosa]
MNEKENVIEAPDVIPESVDNINNHNKMGKGFRTIELISRVVIAVISRFWKLCMSTALMLLLIFWFNGGALTLILLIFSVLGIFFNAQDMLLYYPDQPPQSRLYVEMPSLYNLPFENHFVKTADGIKINLVFIKHKNSNAPTVIYFHGNAGNIGHRLTNAHGLYTSCGLNILLVEYRGYGKSEGSPYESGLYLDAETALDFILRRNDVDQRNIFIFGRSLGGAVAIHLASQSYYAKFIAGVIVENTFTSSTFKKLVKFENGTHNETWMCPHYYEAILVFIKEIGIKDTAICLLVECSSQSGQIKQFYIPNYICLVIQSSRDSGYFV